MAKRVLEALALGQRANLHEMAEEVIALIEASSQSTCEVLRHLVRASSARDAQLMVAIAVLVDAHSADDAATGFRVNPAAQGYSATAYRDALRVLREKLGRQTEPARPVAS